MAGGVRLILVPEDHRGNELRGLRVEVLAADPTGGDLYEGRVWFNSVSNLLKYYDGTTVIELGAASAGGVETLTVDDATIENVGTANDPSIQVKALGILNAHLASGIAFAKLSAPLAAFDFGAQRLANLGAPTSGTDAATRTYVLDQIAALVDSSPATLDTLNELAAALGDDANFAATTAASLGALDTRLDAIEAGSGPTKKFAASIGDGAATSYVVTHNLNTRDVVVSIHDNATPWGEVLADIEHTSVNTCTIRFAVAPTLNQYRVAVVG